MNQIQIKDFLSENSLITVDESQISEEPRVPKIRIPTYVIENGKKKKQTKKFKALKKQALKKV